MHKKMSHIASESAVQRSPTYNVAPAHEAEYQCFANGTNREKWPSRLICVIQFPSHIP